MGLVKNLAALGLLVTFMIPQPSTSHADANDSAQANSGTLDTALRVVDFDVVTADLDWRVVNDAVMGGRSFSQVRIVDHRLTFTGSLNTNGGGFASVRSSELHTDLSAFSKFRIRLREGWPAFTPILRPFASNT